MLRKLSALTSCVLIASQALAEAPRVSIIIDDLGYDLTAGQRVLALPRSVAVAVLPDAPYATILAEQAAADGRPVLLHLPLQATSDEINAGPGNLTLDTGEFAFRAGVQAYLDVVPQAVGVNTHRGSLLTRHPGHMTWLMDVIRERGNLYFIDSYTTPQSVALSIAREHAVPALRRDVFLDPDNSPETIAREFARLLELARKRGYAVAIGHPYPGTIEYLEALLPTLAAAGIEVVAPDRLLPATEAAAGAESVSAL